MRNPHFRALKFVEATPRLRRTSQKIPRREGSLGSPSGAVIGVPQVKHSSFNDSFTLLLNGIGRADPVLGGAAPWVALALIVATVLLANREDRRRANAPFWLLVLYFVLALVLAFIPPRHSAEDELQVLAGAFALASIARSLFVLFAYSFWLRKVARPLPKILRDVIQGFIFLVGFLLVLRSAGVEPGSLLATSALLTAVIGLSLQDTLGNLFAGLAIQAQRPFTVGDWVQLDSQGTQIGRVIEINWRATKILTLDQVEVIVPNGVVAKNPIVNFSVPTSLARREAEMFASSELSPEFVRRILLTAVEHVSDVLRQPPPQVFTRGFTERGMSYALRYYIDRFDRREIIDSIVRERIWYAMQRAKMAMPVPRRHIEILEHRQASGEPAVDASKAQLVGRTSLFQKLPAESQVQLAETCHRKRYAPEELIVRKGEQASEMYLIESGRVRIELPTADGRGLVAADLGPGEFFGEMSLMTGEERAADVVASEETSVLVIGRSAIVPLMEKHPDIVEHMSRVLTERQARLAELKKEGQDAQRDSVHDELELVRRIRRFFGS